MSEHQHVRAYMTPEIAEEILTRLADGEPLMRICGPDRHPCMPDRATVHKHLRENDRFQIAYRIAREAQAATLAEEILAIADGEQTDGGKTRDLNRDRLRVAARKWLVSVIAPRSYGPRADVYGYGG